MNPVRDMKLYNTLGRKLEKVEPLNSSELTLYTCGPTVYLEPHIGNWRGFIFYDILERALKLSGFKVKRAMNITDVGHLVGDGDEGEDKVQKAAQSQRKTAWEVAEANTKLFKAEMSLLNIRKPKLLLKATEHIKEQILLLEILDKKGFTYKTSDGVYFDTSRAKDYGKLAGGTKGHKAGARVAVNKAKRHPQDFALWKFTPKGQQRDMEWNSPWGKGFPGWHLECSAMALEYLGETIDIHTGGVDHIGTHHTNEIAQSEAATGKPFAQLWVHNEFLLAEGKKMAKSSGGYITLSDIINKGFSPLSFRLLVLRAHYKTQLNFTWKSLEGAQAHLGALYGTAQLQHQASSIMETESDSKFTDLLAKTEKSMRSALADNLDTPAAVARLQRVVDHLAVNQLHGADIEKFKSFLKFCDDGLGLGLAEQPNLNDEQKELIAKREAARQNGEFKEADSLRDQLAKQGVKLNDTEFGVIWNRTPQPIP